MISSKIFRAARANLFRIRIEFLKKKPDKTMIYSKNFPRCARQFIENFFVKLWKIVDIFKIFCAARANMFRVGKNFWSKIMTNNTNKVQLLHSNFKRRMMKTPMVYVKIFRAARADLPTTRRRISFSAFHFLNLYHTQEQDFSAMTCRKMLTEGLLPTLHVK